MLLLLEINNSWTFPHISSLKDELTPLVKLILSYKNMFYIFSINFFSYLSKLSYNNYYILGINYFKCDNEVIYSIYFEIETSYKLQIVFY